VSSAIPERLPILGEVFNIQGSEMIFLLLVALIILGPEKLPDAVRKFGRLYGEFKKMANGFQGEIRSALDEPMRELRDTANLVRDAARFDIMGSSPQADTAAEPGSAVPATPVATEPGLNFGSAHPRAEVRPPRIVPADDVAPDAPNEAAGDPA
jgi:sec-independent protein translocase protein TatB